MLNLKYMQKLSGERKLYQEKIRTNSLDLTNSARHYSLIYFL